MIPKDYEFLIYGFLGLLAIAVIGETLHLFIPINWGIAIILLFCFTVWLCWECPREAKLDLILYLGIAWILTALVPRLWYNYYDTGLYHLQAMRWIVEYPVQFGLANVHYRLGYNSIWFTLEAIVDRWVLFSNIPCFVLNALVVFIYSIPAVMVIRKPELKTSDIFYLLTFAPILAFGGIFLTSASPDLFVMLLCFTVFLLLVKFYEEPDRNILFIAVILSAFAGMVKASMLLLFVIVLAIYIQQYRWKDIWIVPLLFLPWLITGIITSGYLLYPFSFTRLPVEWSVPVTIALQDASDIVSYAWRYGNYIPVLLEATILTVITLVFFRKKQTTTLVPLVIAGIGVSVWLLTAPEPRYGLGFIFAVPLLLLASGLTDSKHRMKYIGILICAAIIQGILIYLIYLHTNIPFTFPEPIGDQIWNSGLR